MSDENIVDFQKEKFARNLNPAANDPVTALREALDWVIAAAATGTPVDHIIICLGRTTDDNGSGTKYFQAGKFAHHGQMGLLFEVQHMVRDSG